MFLQRSNHYDNNNNNLANFLHLKFIERSFVCLYFTIPTAILAKRKF